MTVNNCASPNKVPVPPHKAAPQKGLVSSQYKQQVSLQEQEQSDIRLPSYPQACNIFDVEIKNVYVEEIRSLELTRQLLLVRRRFFNLGIYETCLCI